MVLCVLNAGAQDKKIVAAQKAVEKAKIAAADEKKAAKADTWVKLAKAYLQAYDAPTGDFMIGTSLQEMQLIAQQEGRKLEQPSEVSQVDINGTAFTVNKYENFDCYLNEGGRISALVVTKPAVDNALEEALRSFSRAAELDAAGKKSKDIIAGLQTINDRSNILATIAFTLGDMPKASKCFVMCADALSQAPLCQVDTVSLYNAGLTAYLSQDFEAAKLYYGRCIEYGYWGGDGEAYVKLADIAANQDKDDAKAQELLEEAFVKCPQSQMVLIELINFYSMRGTDTDRLFVLLDNARQTDTTGKFLYYYNYVEGNIRLQLGDEAGAVAAYERSAEAKPDYEFAYIGKAQVYSKKADALVEKANAETDWRKYDAIVEEYNAAMRACVEPYEKAYEFTKDEGLKADLANILKQVCFRFREEPAYKDKYDYYDSIVKANQ